MKYFFSIITASYNGACHIEQLLKSLAVQTCKDFELIIQDNLSTDLTLSIVKNWEKKLPHVKFYSEKDSGIYDAWNRAIKKSAGEWYLFLGADDQLAGPNCLERCKDILESTPQSITYAAGDMCTILYDNQISTIREGIPEGVLQKLPDYMPICNVGLLYRKDLFATEKFNTFFKISGDYDFMCRTWKNDGQCVRLNLLLTKMLDGGVSSSHLHRARGLVESIIVHWLNFRKYPTPAALLVLAKSTLVSLLFSFLGKKKAPAILDYIRIKRNLPPYWQKQEKKRQFLRKELM